MTELLQFSLLDMTPYDRRSWFNLIAGYHQAIWPVHLLTLLVLLLLSLKLPGQVKNVTTTNISTRLTLAALGLSWLWCGGVFHLQYFVSLNWAAPLFGVVFMVQGGLLVLVAILLRTATWVAADSWRGRLGIILLLTGLFVYPLAGLAEGRTVLQLEVFPLLPAPVTLVTFALLILLNSAWRHGLVVIPLIWAIISAAFAWTPGLTEAYFMLAAVIVYGLIPFLSSTHSGIRSKRS